MAYKTTDNLFCILKDDPSDKSGPHYNDNDDYYFATVISHWHKNGPNHIYKVRQVGDGNYSGSLACELEFGYWIMAQHLILIDKDGQSVSALELTEELKHL